jgi:hypothetical protein
MAHLNFQATRRQHGISIPQLAEVAGVVPRDAYLFEIGARVKRHQAVALVGALNALTGRGYILSDFLAPLCEQPTMPVPIVTLKRMS